MFSVSWLRLVDVQFNSVQFAKPSLAKNADNFPSNSFLTNFDVILKWFDENFSAGLMTQIKLKIPLKTDVPFLGNSLV